MDTCWLHITAGSGFMHADTHCVVFKTYESASDWIHEAYGYRDADIVEAYDKLQAWFDDNFQDDCPYSEEFCINVFGNEEQENWDDMCEQMQMQMPYGLKEMTYGKVEMVIGQGRY